MIAKHNEHELVCQFDRMCRCASQYAFEHDARVVEIDSRSHCALFEQDEPSDPSGRNPQPTSRWWRFF